MSKSYGKSLLCGIAPPGETEKQNNYFVTKIKQRIESGEDRNIICQDALHELYPGNREINCEVKNRSIQTTSFNPENITLEPEYYHNIDKEKFSRVKPLIWLWMMFDRSSSGRNLHLGIIFRRMLASFIFKKLGEDVKIFHNVELSFGYNLEVGSGTVIHREVMLDDRGGLIIGNNVSISDYAAIYSHSHDTVDIHNITLGKTVIGEGTRIMYHSTVLSGIKIGRQATLGAHALATRNIRDYHIHVGIPAKSVKVKPNAPLISTPFK